MNSLILRMIAARVGVALVTLMIVAVTIFCATALLPGDVAEIILGQAATPGAVAGLRTAMNLDQPAILRFFLWLQNLATGDLGVSYVNNIPVADLIGARLVNSLELAGITAFISVPVALTLGITAAILRGSAYDRVISFVTIGMISVPEFLVATLAVLVFAVYLGWLPALSMTADVSSFACLLKAYAMPVITLSFVISAQMIHMTRAVIIETLEWTGPSF